MMNLLRKGNLWMCVLVLAVVCLGIVFASDVVVKEGKIEAENVDANSTIEGDIFKSTGCTATGTKAVAIGYNTTASGGIGTAMGWNTKASGTASTAMGCSTDANGVYSTAMGFATDANGDYSTATGCNSTASGLRSIAMGSSATASGENSIVIGSYSEASATSSTAMGMFSKNNISNSFTVGYGSPGAGNDKVDFRVRSDLVNVYGDLVVDDKVGIGTTSPDNLLSIKSSTSAEDWAIHFTADDNGNVMYIGKDSADNFFLYGYDGNGGCDVYLRTGGAPSYINSGNVGIRTTNPAYDLDVNGDIRAIGSVYYGGTVGNANGTAYSKPDYVFEEGYDAMSIDQVEAYLKKENHLPWMTSVKQEKEENGDVIDMTRMAFETVETAENLQIQVIELNKLIKEQAELIKIQQKRISVLEETVTQNEMLKHRLEMLEKAIQNAQSFVD
ncbi:MAG: hypothetical protein GWN00_22050 [Aliifodinibius sp.]|nr:hypothetical protein [Phycisphaerae bacterium]NIT58804.1 hypothetical protein [Fodinibius sp.]NIY27387.1 hypothetical protein [Fodinibius sp.]